MMNFSYKKPFIAVAVAGLFGLLIIKVTNHQQVQIPDVQKTDLNAAQSKPYSELDSGRVVKRLNAGSVSFDDTITGETVIETTEVAGFIVGEEPEPAMETTDPTEQQMEYQVLLEQKATGQIQVMGPLISEITRSKEFLALTRDQQFYITTLILDRLNSGELRQEDAFPGWPKKN